MGVVERDVGVGEADQLGFLTRDLRSDSHFGHSSAESSEAHDPAETTAARGRVDHGCDCGVLDGDADALAEGQLCHVTAPGPRPGEQLLLSSGSAAWVARQTTSAFETASSKQ